MTIGQPASEFRYWAFISYSHKDASWGRWLHKALETWRLPRRLVGMPIAAGTVPARLSPIFRDRDELPTASDLGAAVEEALNLSWCLIVICSPESAQSRWVNEEVLAFQRLGRGDRIHCLIVDAGPDPAAPLCFPPALEQAHSKNGNGKSEPIAADARRFADGRSFALLKLIAGILGIRYDTLVQREQQRKHRNLFWITCASLALVVVLATATLIAVTSRRDAVNQRSHAEGLVEFMIGDLRKKLEPDGKLATLDAVGKEALAYYAAQKSEDLDADGLARRARALHMIGEVYDLRGELDEALKVFKQAADSTAELLAREPDNGQRIFDHAQSVFWVGNVAYEREQYDNAEKAFLEYKDLADRLVRLNPENEAWLAEQGSANVNLGALFLDRGQLDVATPYFLASMRIATDLSKRDPRDLDRKFQTAQAHAWLAASMYQSGQLEEVVEHRKSEAEIYREILSIDPENKSAGLSMLVAQRSLAELSLYLGEVNDAARQLAINAEQAAALLRQDPENTVWMAEVCETSLDLSEAQRLEEQNVAADASLTLANECIAKLTEKDASRPLWQKLQGRARLLEATRLVSAEDYPSAQKLLESLLQKVEKGADVGPKKPHDDNWLSASAWLLLGDVHQLCNQRNLALTTWESAVAAIESDSSSAQPPMQAMLASALLRLGRVEEAKPILQNLEKIHFAQPDFVQVISQYPNPTK